MTTGTPSRVDDDVAVLDRDLGVEARASTLRLLGAALRRTADVEGAHGELGAGLADRLRGDDADRLADIDGACRAPDRGRSTCRRRRPRVSQVSTERIEHRIDAGPLDLRRPRPRRSGSPALTIDLARSADRRCRSPRVRPRMRSAERRDDLAAFDHGAHGEAARGAAILLGDDRVLRDVDETAGQVARVRRLQARCRPDPCGRRGSS